MKVKEATSGYPDATATSIGGDYVIYCPGCKTEHRINTKRKLENGALWTFNGDSQNPTFSPSVNIFYQEETRRQHPNLPEYRCHFNITGGMIIFCADTTHELKGKTVLLPDRF